VPVSLLGFHPWLRRGSPDEWKHGQASPRHLRRKAFERGRAARSQQKDAAAAAAGHAAHPQTNRWPCAIIGPYKRPVDAWATIRGEIAMGRSDPIRWLTLPDYLEARLRAAQAQVEAEEHAAAVAMAKDRQARAGTVLGKTRVRPLA
jgi:hypothetical protein